MYMYIATVSRETRTCGSQVLLKQNDLLRFVTNFIYRTVFNVNILTKVKNVIIMIDDKYINKDYLNTFAYLFDSDNCAAH